MPGKERRCRMEWQQIIGFYHVAKLKSFTRAAEATYRTQSALTQQVKALEAEFDCELIERIDKRKIKLTPMGEKFFKFSAQLGCMSGWSGRLALS